jgi:hypothetical protein
MGKTQEPIMNDYTDQQIEEILANSFLTLPVHEPSSEEVQFAFFHADTQAKKIEPDWTDLDSIFSIK